VIAEAWGLKEAFRSIYDASDSHQAELRLDRFLAAVGRAQLPAFTAFAEHQEQRSFDIVEQLNSKAAARGVMRKIMLGTNLSKIAIHESLERANIADTAPGTRAIRRAIFAAKPGVLVGPMLLNNLYAVFAVTRIVPRVVQPLTRVQGSIEMRLAEVQQRRTLAKFIKTWRSRWTARTDCHPGYVVQKCRQYTGPKAPEDPLALN
jgi:hypothetical protein